MTLEELEKKLSELDDLRSELNKKIEEMKTELYAPPHPRWKPKYEEHYYYIAKNGEINGINRWDGNSVDKQVYDSANMFKTEAEAEFALEKRKVLAEMNEWAGHNYDGAYIYYHRPSDEIMINWDGNSTYCFGDIRFKCVDDAENCIKAVGKERIKKYYFGISDKEDN